MLFGKFNIIILNNDAGTAPFNCSIWANLNYIKCKFTIIINKKYAAIFNAQLALSWCTDLMHILVGVIK